MLKHAVSRLKSSNIGGHWYGCPTQGKYWGDMSPLTHRDWRHWQRSPATRDQTLIWQNKFYWISNRSDVAELVCTITVPYFFLNAQNVMYVACYVTIVYAKHQTEQSSKWLARVRRAVFVFWTECYANATSIQSPHSRQIWEELQWQLMGSLLTPLLTCHKFSSLPVQIL